MCARRTKRGEQFLKRYKVPHSLPHLRSLRHKFCSLSLVAQLKVKYGNSSTQLPSTAKQTLSNSQFGCREWIGLHMCLPGTDPSACGWSWAGWYSCLRPKTFVRWPWKVTGWVRSKGVLLMEPSEAWSNSLLPLHYPNPECFLMQFSTFRICPLTPSLLKSFSPLIPDFPLSQ